MSVGTHVPFLLEKSPPCMDIYIEISRLFSCWGGIVVPPPLTKAVNDKPVESLIVGLGMTYLAHEAWDDAMKYAAFKVECLASGLACPKLSSTKRSEVLCSLQRNNIAQFPASHHCSYMTHGNQKQHQQQPSHALGTTSAPCIRQIRTWLAC